MFTIVPLGPSIRSPSLDVLEHVLTDTRQVAVARTINITASKNCRNKLTNNPRLSSDRKSLLRLSAMAQQDKEFILDNAFLQSISQYKTITIDSSFNELFFNSSKYENLEDKTLIIRNVKIFHLNKTQIENSHMNFYLNGKKQMKSFQFLKLINVTFPQQYCPLGNIGHNNFNNLIHQKVEEIKIFNSTIKSINSETFGTLSGLQKLVLELHNFRQFIQESDLKWMAKLNFASQLNDLSDYETIKKLKSSVLNDFQKEYDYPDEDFCKFIHLPHNNFVFPVIYSKPNLNCTCTLAWLLLNYKLERFFKSMQEDLSMRTNSVLECLEIIDQRIVECDFGKKLSNCGLVFSKPTYHFTCSNDKNSSCPSILIEIGLMFLTLLIGLPINFLTFYTLVKFKLSEKIYVSISCALLANFLMVLDRSKILPIIIAIGIVLNIHQIDFLGPFSNHFSWYYSLRLNLNIVQDIFYIQDCCFQLIMAEKFRECNITLFQLKFGSLTNN
ncbi:hypothetical protein BpHYR1_002590 [Brachionus plicatilis]|uniref:Uncharacterized protein n=1 Tax=Brachionus plicatilis TaxID=10195 RepID=A0A3M7RUY8_BRAPC|nr:hypothetical protein BpHYR1_002590 [Brachionus plicatilis]